MKFRIHAKLMLFLLLAKKEHQVSIKNTEACPAKNTSSHNTNLVTKSQKEISTNPLLNHQPIRPTPKVDLARGETSPMILSPSATNVGALGTKLNTAKPLNMSSICIESSRNTKLHPQLVKLIRWMSQP